MRLLGERDVSAFDTLDHDKHRQRREPWNPFFSKLSVSRLQPLLIQASIDKLCARLAEYGAAGKPAVMTHAYASLTTNIISEYSFSKGYNLLGKPEFDSKHYDAWMALSKATHVFKQLGWLYPLLDSIPIWLTKYTSREMYLVLCLQDDLQQQTNELVKRRKNPDHKIAATRPSLMEAIMDSPRLPESDKSPKRVKAEALVAIGAVTLTTTHALKAATYHILANPPVHARLLEELENHIPDPNHPLNLRELEQLPCLNAIIFETLRIFSGNSHRFQRIFPSRVLQYKTCTIPAGTPSACPPSISTTIRVSFLIPTTSTPPAGRASIRRSNTSCRSAGVAGGAWGWSWRRRRS